MIWTTNRNGEPRIRKNTASGKKLTINSSAAWTAFRASTIGPAEELAADALLQPVLVPVQEMAAHVRAVEQRRDLLRILLRHVWTEDLPEGDREALGDLHQRPAERSQGPGLLLDRRGCGCGHGSLA